MSVRSSGADLEEADDAKAEQAEVETEERGSRSPSPSKRGGSQQQPESPVNKKPTKQAKTKVA